MTTDNVLEARATATRAGLVVLGEVGSSEDAHSVWRAFTPGRAVPTVRVPATEDDGDMRDLQNTWLARARASKVISEAGEFLLSIETSHTSVGPWLHVRLGAAFDISGLGLDRYQPEFVVSDLGRRACMAVFTDEDEYWIFSSRTDPETGRTPTPTDDHA